MAVNRAGGRPFEKRDVDLLRSFATQTVLALQQAELRRERQRRIVLEERERLAHELHDDAIQSLRDISYGLAGAADRTGDPVLRERVAGMVGTLENVIGDLRNHIYGLCPSVLSGRSVEEALRQLVHDFEKQSGVSTVVEVESGEVERLRDQAGEVVQIVREALSNVWRHARAKRCRVSLRISEGNAWLLVQDDGVGFDPSRIQPNGHGLGNFRERVDRLGGRLEIESWSNTGTTLRITIPLDRRRTGREPAHPSP
jgi:signal transduction histidine kinase